MTEDDETTIDDVVQTQLAVELEKAIGDASVNVTLHEYGDGWKPISRVMRVMYASHVEAGFTPTQALKLVITWLQEAMRLAGANNGKNDQ